MDCVAGKASVLSLRIVRLLLAVLEHLVLCFLLLLQVFLHRFLLPLLGFALSVALCGSGVVTPREGRGVAQEEECEAKDENESFHKYPSGSAVAMILL